MAVCVLIQACTDDSYHGAAERYRDDMVPLPVNVFVGEPERAETKGHGAVDFEDGMTFEGRNIYVYAFNGATDTDYSVLSSVNPATCLIDGSIDEPGSLGGKQAVLSDLHAHAEWTGTDRPLYPTGDLKSIPYGFFAYYLDTLKLDNSSIHRTRDSISVDIKFDGSMDIMTAHSVYEGAKEDSLLAYSYDTARKGINPVFTFNHKLVKLIFRAEAGVIESRKKKELNLREVNVMSADSANLTVAYAGKPKDDGIRFVTNSVSRLTLREKDGSELKSDTYVIQNPPPTEDTPPIKIGGSLLVAPADSYTAYVYIKEKNIAGVNEGYSEISLEYEDGFKVGCSYLINLKVYGYMDVETTVTLVPWNYGGDIYAPDYEYPGY